MTLQSIHIVYNQILCCFSNGLRLKICMIFPAQKPQLRWVFFFFFWLLTIILAKKFHPVSDQLNYQELKQQQQQTTGLRITDSLFS